MSTAAVYCATCDTDHPAPTVPSTATEEEAAAVRWQLVDCHDGIQHWENRPEDD